MDTFLQNPFSFSAIVLGVCLSVFAAFYQLSEAPAIWYDEGFYTQMAQNVADGSGQTIQVAPGEFISGGVVTLGFPVVYPVSVAYKLFGVGVLEGRVVMALFLIAFVSVAIFLAYLLFSVRYAAWAALLLASFPMLYGNGKPVLGEVPGLFFLILTLIAIVFLERSGYRNLWAYAGVGFAAGLCVVTKPIFILLAPALFFMWVLHRKEISLRLGGFVVSVIAGLVPLGMWLATQFGSGDSLGTIAAFYANPYETTDILASTVVNITRLVTEMTPLYLLISLTLWGCSWFVRKDIRVSPAERTAFFFAGFILLAFLRMPGWYRYLFPALTLSLVFLPFALFSIVAFIQDRFRLPHFVTAAQVLVLSTLILLQTYQLGFSSYVAQYYDGVRTQTVGAYLQNLPDGSVLLYDTPEVAILLSTRNYYQYLQPHPSQVFGQENLARLSDSELDFVIVGTEKYQGAPEQFARYRLRDTVNRYAILERAE